MSSTVMERARRSGALLLLKLARLILRGIVALRISGLSLRCSLSFVSALERMGARLLLGYRGRHRQTFCDRD